MTQLGRPGVVRYRSLTGLWVGDVAGQFSNRATTPIDEVGSVCGVAGGISCGQATVAGAVVRPGVGAGGTTVRELPGMSPLGEIFEIGPPGQSVRDEFERVPDGVTGPESIPVFDSVSGHLRSSLAGEPDAFWRVRPDSRRRRRAKSGLVESHLQRAGLGAAGATRPHEQRCGRSRVPSRKEPREWICSHHDTHRAASPG